MRTSGLGSLERNEQRVQRKEVGNGFLGKRGKRVGIAKRITFLDLLRFCSAAILLYYFQARRRQKWTESRRRIARSSLFTRRTQDLRMHSLPFEYLDERGIPLEFHWDSVLSPLCVGSQTSLTSSSDSERSFTSIGSITSIIPTPFRDSSCGMLLLLSSCSI